MRQFVIDELSRQERDALDSYLHRTLRAGSMDGTFWLELPRSLWTDVQLGHEKCGPFYFGVVLGDDQVCFELLVRSQSTLHCECIAHATKRQRDFVLEFADTMLAGELIRA